MLNSRRAAAILLLFTTACASNQGAAARVDSAPGTVGSATTNAHGSPGLTWPVVDHHKHLISSAAAPWASETPQPAVDLSPNLARLLTDRASRWNDAAALAELYTEHAILLEDWERLTGGRAEVAALVGRKFARPYRITPIAQNVEGQYAQVAGYFSRDTDEGVRHFGHVLLSLTRERGGAWRIATEAQLFPGPHVQPVLTTEQLIAELDAARTQRAVVLSVAYWFGSGQRELSPEDEYARVRAENDWTAEQAARFPERLIAFCSFNPLRDYAVRELERCAAHPGLHGLKLHLANSRVDIHDPKHVEQLRLVFRTANRHRLPIVIHLWTGPEYSRAGREHAEIFLNRVLPEAPDVTVQIAHFAGGGPGYTDAALEVYAEAVAAGDPRTVNLYVELATVADGQSAQVLETLARRIRQIGLQRVLWGTDAAPPNPLSRQSWLTFRGTLPLTEEEFAAIASNVAPYLR